MASLTQSPVPDHLPPPSSQASSFTPPPFPHHRPSLISIPSSLPPSSLPGFSSHPLLQELDSQSLPFASFHHDMPPAAWHQPPPPAGNVGLHQQHLLSADKPMMSTFGLAEGRMLAGHILAANSSPGSMLSLKGSPELMGSPLSGGTWEMASDQKLALPISTNPLAHPLNVSSHGISEGPSGRELVDRLENTIASKGVSSLLSPSRAMALGQGIEKMFNLGAGWNSLNAANNLSLTVDPAKGGLAIQGVNLAASHCLANFSSDPGFAERAARFSCFSNQGFSEAAASFPLTEGGKTYPRSVARSSDKSAVSKLGRISSFPSARSGTLRSPSGDHAVGELQDVCAVPEGFCGRLPQEPATRIEDGKITGRASCSPARIEPIEAMPKLGSSVNESDEGDAGLGQDESSSSGQGACEVGSQAVIVNTGKKRKNGSKDKPLKEAPRAAANLAGKDCKNADAADEPKGKRYKGADDHVKDQDEEQKLKVEQCNSGNSGDSTPKSKESSKPPDAPKPDYIHVRARRGQATDSHSLAERVRREKISERMKFLQDLVPGCSKVTGKAVMLDEIINYVQSLQRQVEFLSMKLAAVNPRLDFNIDSFFNKEMFQPRVFAPSILFGPDNTNNYASLHQPPQCPLQVGVSCGMDAQTLGSPADSALRRTNVTPLASMDAYGDTVSQQISQAWDDELQSVVQMGFGQGRLIPLTSQQGLPGRLQAGHMKVEL